MLILKILDPVHTEIVSGSWEELNEHLKYTGVVWKKSKGKMTRVEYPVYMIKKINSRLIFPAGFLPRVENFLISRQIPYQIAGSLGVVEFSRPSIPGLTFRPDQQKLIIAALSRGRGVLQAPTGSGKTLILLGLISAFNQENILFLCHTLSLVSQFRSELIKWGFSRLDIGVLSGEEKTVGRIQLALIQSFSRQNPEDYVNKYDVILVDEAHHVSSYKGLYAKVLQNSLAPVRIGVTATMPYKPEAVFALEGLIGPKLGEFTVEEGHKVGIIAKPKIKIIKVPEQGYFEIYKHEIVDNSERNSIIIDEAYKQTQKGKSVLININLIEHGKILETLGLQQGISCEFIYASADSDLRDKIKEALDSKKIGCVIASAIFKEGVNIPSLDCCINAAGGKSEIATLQALGRGLRTTKTKKEVLLIDFQDTGHPHLRRHFKIRYEIYKKNKWVK